MKAKAKMSQTVGVRQGDCMAPVIFLFMIIAFEETIAIKWKDMGLNTMSLHTWTNSTHDSGSLKGQLPKTFSEGVLLELFNVLCVENFAFPFEDRDQLTLGAQLIFDHFKRFRTEMHIGRGGKSSKTECMFFPPLGLLKKKQILPAPENGILDTLTKMLNTVHEKGEEKGSRKETEYNQLAKTRLIVVADCFISFYAHFKYLGSWLSFSLRDDYNVGRRIGISNASMGALA